VCREERSGALPSWGTVMLRTDSCSGEKARVVFAADWPLRRKIPNWHWMLDQGGVREGNAISRIKDSARPFR